MGADRGGPAGLRSEWRFISLRLLNARVDYAAQFPPEYEAGPDPFAKRRLMWVGSPTIPLTFVLTQVLASYLADAVDASPVWTGSASTSAGIGR